MPQRKLFVGFLFQAVFLRPKVCCGFLSSAKQKRHTPSREKENDALKGSKDPFRALTLLA
jgi:hypothetical protein